MLYIDPDTSEKTLVDGDDYEGLGIKRQEVIKHLEELRGLAYTVINSILIANAKLANDFML